MCGKNDLCATFYQCLDGRKRSVNTSGIGNVSLFIKWNIEVRADEDVAGFDALLEKIVKCLESHYLLLN